MIKKVIPFLVVLIIPLSFVLFMPVFLSSCYYDKAAVVPCDTTLVRYSVEIKGILDANCQQCHSPSNAPAFGGDYNLYDYATISFLALDGNFTYGTLLSSVKKQGGAPAMPQDGSTISDCELNKITAWVNQGAQDN